MSTRGFAMSNTTSDQANVVPTEEASSPAQEQTSAEAPQTEPTSADNAAPTSDSNTQPEATSDASDDQPSPTNDPSQSSADPSPTNSAAESDTAASSPPAESDTPAEESDSPSATQAPSPSQTASSAGNSAAQPTTAAESSDDPEPSPTSDDNNDDESNTEDSSQPTTATEEESETPLTTVVTVTNTSGGQTTIVLVTYSTTNRVTAAEPTASASNTSEPEAIDTSSNSDGGLDQKSKVAIGVVVPIAAIAILALVGLFWWKKRRARQHAEEERRKEVEDYAYNPNADPTIPTVGMSGGDGGYEMKEDGSSGYRGWGNTTIGSTGRKASTTMSGGVGQAYSDVTSPTTRGNMSDARSGEPLMDGPHSPEGEILGAMGPSASNNRGADVHRGPSNASSSYSAAGRSDASDQIVGSYGAGGQYYDQYAHNNPYSDNGYGQQSGAAPVIRDNPARRNTRIEGPSHYPQQSAGISQNF